MSALTTRAGTLAGAAVGGSSASTQDPKVRLAIDENGNIHRFFNDAKDGTGSYHWSGSTADKASPLTDIQLGKFSKIIKNLRSDK